MNARLDPFKDVSRLEKELKRNELYEDIMKQLKSESYDASPIGHHFVTQYEQQLPGIITAVSGDHSFLNSDDETNRRVIMEAVSGGMALKAGLVAAVLMIIYKIIRVMTNNPAFKAGGGGGRGTAPYVAQKQEELVKAAENLKNAMKEAKDSIAIVKGNAAARDETSPQYEAAEKAASAYRVYTQVGNGSIKEDTKQSTQDQDPLKTISDMDLTAFGFGSLPAFFMCKRREDFLQVAAAMDAIIKALKQYSPGRLADMVEQVTVKLSRPQDSAFLLTPAYNNMVSELVSKIGKALGLESVDPSTLTRLSINPELKESYDVMIRTSYGQMMEEKDEAMIPLADFIVDYAETNGEFAERSKIVADFNTSFNEFIGDNKELEDSGYYSNLQHYATKLAEYKQDIKQAPGLANKDELIKRIDLLISIIETYTKFLLAMLCVFRKEADKIDTFREVNIDKMNKLAKALVDFANATREETT